MIIGISGTRSGLTDKQKDVVKKVIEKLKKKHEILELHHGDCVGADEEVHEMVVNDNLVTSIYIHPPINPNLRAFVSTGPTGPTVVSLPEEDYLIRNKNIVKVIDLLIVCPKEADEINRSGTWATYRNAKKMNKKIILIRPDGNSVIWPDKNLISKIKKHLQKI